MKDISPLLKEDHDHTLFLMQSPESLEQIYTFCKEVDLEKKKLKTLDAAYYESLIVNWKDKLLKYPLAVTENHPFVSLYGVDLSIPFAFLEELGEQYKEISHVCEQRKRGVDIPFICHFVAKSTPVLSCEKEDYMSSFLKERLKIDRSSIYMDFDDNRIVFKSKNDGFLLYGDKGLQILPPLVDEKNLYSLTLRLIPIVTGIDVLVEFVNRFLEDHREKYPKAPLLSEPFSDKTVRRQGLYTYGEFEIIAGQEPQQGKDSSLKYSYHGTHEKETAHSTDFYEICQIHTVKEGDVVAVKKLFIPGIDGIDIFGNKSQVKKGKDFAIHVDENILVERFETEYHYIARISGVINITENSISLEETLVVENDVDFHTGNISYEKNIHIKGDVRSGFKVICKKDLLIDGLVEDKVQIECEGTLKIGKGIIGEKTHVKIGGNLYCSFIERSDILCLGDIFVKKNIQGGHISSMGSLFVLGEGLSKKKVGVISGAVCKSYTNIKALSLGAASNNTQLFLGYNSLVDDKISSIDEVINSLKVNITQLMSVIPFDLTSSLAIRKLKKANDKTKKNIKRILFKIKRMNLEIENLELRRESLNHKRYSDNLENTFVESLEGIKGDVTVYYQNIQKKLNQDVEQIKIIYNEYDDSIDIVK